MFVSRVLFFLRCLMNTRDYYIFKNGSLIRKDNTLYLKPLSGNEGSKSDFKTPIPIPIENVSDIYLFGEIVINTKLISFLAQKNVCFHSFNYYGYYSGSFTPKDFIPSGCVQLNQAKHILDKKKSLCIAKEIIESALFHCNRNLRYRSNRGIDLSQEISKIEVLIQRIVSVKSNMELMGVEGNARRIYYEGLGKIFPEEFCFESRNKRPPKDEVNAAISFVNSLTYTACLSQIYRTHLSPVMSFLHTPGTQRFSLCLDLAEIFKPLIGDRFLIRLFNKKQLTKKIFKEKGKHVYFQKKDAKKF